ncbi:MAG: sugar nucleotide-binding protein, partial [Caulobacteraceae bacterium]|nr:sugar nucleotide-binding protein [Caulobacteraceae bacterium]
AALGVKTLRYPLLWERVSPDRPDVADWRWLDERLGRLRALGVSPIAGLIHHGSGPLYAGIADEGFAGGLAVHAAAAARRYPWIEAWTPVNEPLTTARFTCLYGHWHPHGRDERLFWTALLNEVDATRLAMRAIREVTPGARLVQTEDLGRTYATSSCADQAAFDNERRWVSLDLLCGRLAPGHPLWPRLAIEFGFEARLRAILDDACPPDVVGVNHYVTSDRFLDHRLERYAPQFHGGNYFDRYADVEAVRVVTPGPDGLVGVLEDAWSRYGRPLAVTERHLGCTREEQMRWLAEAWTDALALRQRGVEVLAVTAWALFGSHNWRGLLTRTGDSYEPGAFDVRGDGPPRPTAVAGLISALATGERAPDIAVQPGWWRRDVRLQHKPHFRSVDSPAPRPLRLTSTISPRPILITGATGTLGRALARSCEWRGLDYVLTDRARLPLGHVTTAARVLRETKPWAVINAAGYVRVDEAQTDREACFAANADGATVLARLCAERDVAFATFSSDLVFDGEARAAYLETDFPKPLNVYGESKARAEAGVLDAGGRGLVVRTSAFFSPFDPYNFAAHVRRILADDGSVEAASDLVVSPTYTPDLVDAVLDLLIDGETGLWHLANEGSLSWADFATAIARTLGADATRVRPRPAASFGWPAPRPRFAALASGRGRMMPTLGDALARYGAAIG